MNSVYLDETSFRKALLASKEGNNYCSAGGCRCGEKKTRLHLKGPLKGGKIIITVQEEDVDVGRKRRLFQESSEAKIQRSQIVALGNTSTKIC